MTDRSRPPGSDAAPDDPRPLLIGLALAAAGLAWLAIFLPLIPADGRGLGGDYQLHLPNLLAGYFFFLRNGLLAVPWFNPAECGGVPFFADLNVAYYSLPQFLAFLVDPLTAVRITFVVFAAAGTLGFYTLARTRFAASPAAAAVAAGLFLFNGFYAYRMAIGHITFHPFALTPWVAVVLLPPAARRHPAWNETGSGGLLAALIAGALFAYMFQAGMVHGIAPVAFAVAAIVLVHGIIRGAAWRPWAIFAGAAVVALALSASRLAAGLAFLRNFPRDQYPLPGFPGLPTALRFALESVFWLPPARAGWAALLATDTLLDRPEWEYGVGPVAAVLIAGGAVAAAAAFMRNGSRGRLARALPALLAIVAILALPLVLNWYTPAWNALLKRLPLFGSSTTLLRWFMLYIPLAALLAGLAFDRIFGSGSRLVAMGAVLAATILANALVDKSLYRDQHYDGGTIVAAWQKVHAGAPVPAITAVVVPAAATADRPMVLAANDALAAGGSQMLCYQPMFGYQLESFPRGALHPGPILASSPGGTVNLKNPACDLFPTENGCRPGDQFRAGEVAAVEAFAAYGAFPFARSATQLAADRLNLAALLFLVVALPLVAVRRARIRATVRLSR